MGLTYRAVTKVIFYFVNAEIAASLCFNGGVISRPSTVQIVVATDRQIGHTFVEGSDHV